MKINKNSWHYKFLNKHMNVYPIKNNLCGYFWQVVGHLALSVFVLTSCLFIVLTMLSPLLLFFKFKINEFLVAGIIIDILIILILLPALLRKIFKKPIGSNNLILEYIKAKKSKLCPIIEFVDEERK